MELIRITAQGPESPSEFYAREAAECRRQGKSVEAEMLDTMIACLDYLRCTVASPPIYAVTSHYRLRLIGGDDYTLPTLVVVQPVIDGPKTYGLEIAYELPTAEAPWKNAWVRGLASDAPAAAEMIQIALRRNAHASCAKAST